MQWVPDASLQALHEESTVKLPSFQGLLSDCDMIKLLMLEDLRSESGLNKSRIDKQRRMNMHVLMGHIIIMHGGQQCMT